MAPMRDAILRPEAQPELGPIAGRSGVVSIAGVSDEAPIVLRDYQLGANASVRDMFAQGHRKVLGVMSMGGGKTVCFADLARQRHQEGQRTLVLVDQDELVWQAAKQIRRQAGVVPGIEKAEHRASLRDPIVVATVQSMSRRFVRYPADHFGLVVADECDKSTSTIWQGVLNHFDPHADVLGVTATPLRADRKSISTYYQAKAFDIGMFDLIRMGWLAKVTVRTVPLKIDIRGVSQDKGDYDLAELEAALKPYFLEICAAIKEHAANRRTLIFWPLIHTSRLFVDVAEQQGLTARHLDGQSPDRRSSQQDFRDGRFNVLSNAQLFGRGWDEPSVDCVINCRVTRHASTYRQLIGRGVRPSPETGKTDLLILDFLWQFQKFGVMRAADLIAKNARQAAAISAKVDAAGAVLDLEDVDHQVSLEHEEALLEEFRRQRKRRGTVFDALEWAATMDVRSLIEYEPETARDRRPMTGKQATRLEKAGFLLETVQDYGHADRIIKLLDLRIELGLATFKQVHWLRRYGHKGAMQVGFEEAKKLLDRYFGNG